MDCSPSVHGILQARILEWVAMPSSRGSSWSRDWTHLLWLLHCRQILYHWATREALSAHWVNPNQRRLGIQVAPSFSPLQDNLLTIGHTRILGENIPAKLLQGETGGRLPWTFFTPEHSVPFMRHPRRKCRSKISVSTSCKSKALVITPFMDDMHYKSKNMYPFSLAPRKVKSSSWICPGYK